MNASSYFFFNDTATTEIYTLSLHDALPISWGPPRPGEAIDIGAILRSFPGFTVDGGLRGTVEIAIERAAAARGTDRKSTRLNSSHANISYAVFCLKKKKKHSHL